MMKKITLAALFAATATFAGTFETWIGADYATRVETGLGNETNTYGIWYDFNDYYEIETYGIIGGEFRPGSWLYTMSEACYDHEYNCVEYFFDPVVEYCAAICGTAHLREGAPTAQPFVGVAFNVVGKVSKDSPILATGDASAWGGLCVTYSSDADIYLELGLGNTIDSTMNYALPAVKLPASKTDNRIIASWSDFKQPSGYDGSVKFDGETAAKQLASIKFKIQADSGDYDFNICAIGPKDGTCPEKCGSSTTVTAKTFDTWNGADYVYQVQTGLGNETETNGIWYGYGDDNKGGDSKIKWPVEMCHEYETCTKYYFDAVIEHCGGFCGTARLDQGTSATKPFIGVGFNIVGETSTTNNTPAAGDASAWGGLCVTYTSDVDLQLELGLGETVDSTISYANPAVTLPAAKEASFLPPKGKNGNKVIVSWSDFKQPSWYNGSVKFDGETAAKQLVAVKFKLQAEPGDYDFNICAVGPKDGICPEECGITSEEVGIKVTHRTNETTTVKAILNNRTLSFTGVSHATAEVMNSLGQVVAKGAINGAVSTLNLAHLNAGIYMVRVVGKSVNFKKKIVIK